MIGQRMDPIIPDLRKLIDAVMRGSTSRDSFFHGEPHWKCVAWSGLELCRSLPGADRAIVFLFGLLHDTQRLNDGTDPDHGRRAGAFVGRLHGTVFRLSDPQLKTLARACNEHADGLTSPEDVTVGACWDADRLNLWRVGTEPDPRFLSTKPARDPAHIKAPSQLQGQNLTWDAIYGCLAGGIA